MNWAKAWREAAKVARQDEQEWWTLSGEWAREIGSINEWVRFTYDRSWSYPQRGSLLPRLKQLVADREAKARSLLERVLESGMSADLGHDIADYLEDR